MTRTVRVARAAAVALAVALALAGCVGIPSSGAVLPGPAVKNGGDAAPADLPLGPRHNASKTEMVNDFLQAATSSENLYAIARKFLTVKAAQTWDPTTSVLVREKPATPQDVGDDVVDYAVSTKASVNALGIYAEQGTVATQTLSFSFVKVKGQWRISDLPDGIVLSRTSFEGSFKSYPIYFYDPEFRYLIPDLRWFPSGTTVQDRIVTALIKGPSPWLQQGVVASGFPAGVQAGSPVVLRNNAATVDLSASAAATKAQVRGRMRQQLEQSLLGSGVTSVSMTARGAPLSFPDSQDNHAQPAVVTTLAPLVQKGQQFGFSPGLASLGGLSSEIVKLGGTAASVDRADAIAGVLAKGGVYVVTGNGSKPVDTRPGLIAPSIDTFGYVWSVPSDASAAIQATGTDGVVHQISSRIPSDASVVSLNVSHDGTRVLIYLSTSSGPRLIVSGIIRRAGVPTSLGDPLDLPVSSATPIDATWVDPTTVAALGSDATGDVVTSYVIGGSSGDTSTTENAIRIVGTDSDTLRVLTSSGEVQHLVASGWQNIGITVSILATQQ